METKKCLQCNKDFSKRSRDSKKQFIEAKFCSRKCSGVYKQDNFVGFWKGKKLPPEVTKKMSESKKGSIAWNKGKSHNTETRSKISIAKKGKKNPHIGVKWTEETKKKFSITKTGTKLKPETIEKIRKAQFGRKFKYQQQTGIETKIENELTKRGINYQKQVPLCKVARVDFYLPETRTVIQADGCYWHNCPTHGKGFIKNNEGKDLKQDSVLTFNGFNVYRFWEHDINKSVEDCINQLPL